MKITQTKLSTIISYAICGTLCALPFIFNQLWFLGWIAYVPVLVNEYLRKDDMYNPYKKAWLRGLSFFFPFGVVTFCWIVELYPMDFAGIDLWTALLVVGLAVIGIPIFQALFSSFNIVSLCFLKRNRANKWLYPVGAAFTWIVLERLQTLTWAGIPWGKLAMGQVGILQNVQSASLFGSYFISFLMILFSGLLAVAIIYSRSHKDTKRSIIFLVLAACLFLSNFLFGVFSLNIEKKTDKTFMTAAIQGNIETVEKWSDDPYGAMETHKGLVVQAAEAGAELIVLSETSFPFNVEDEYIKEYVEEMANVSRADIIVGCYTYDRNNSYNSTVYVNNYDGVTDQVYKKQKLVPFGEYVPMRNTITTILPFLAELNMLSDDVTSGDSSEIMDTEYGKIGSLICFDSIYEEIALQTVRDGAEILAISTNDSWFQDSAAATQHNAHAVLRSIELGRYVIRAGNTGVSSIITDKGKIVTSLPVLVEGYAIGEVKTITDNTLYTLLGNSIIGVASVFLICVFVCLSIRTHRIKKREEKVEKIKKK